MKILIIKQLFHPEPTARSLDFALELKKQGQEVLVLTGFPSYPQGRIYDGYSQRLFHKETIDGIDVIRVPIFPDQSSNVLMRILNYLSFAISATILGLPRVGKPDVIFAYHGALPVSVPAIVYKVLRRVPVVYDINDIWPETLKATGMLKNKVALQVVEFWCKITYGFVNKITVLSDGFKKLLISKGVPEGKIEVIHHWSRDPFSEDILNEEILKERLFPKEKLKFLFAGNLGAAQSLVTILKVARRLEQEGVHFTFIGSGIEEEKLKSYVVEHGISNVAFCGRVPSNQIAKYMNMADVLVVHLRKDKLFEITIPSKTISYLRVGKPILMGVEGNAAQIISRAKAGLNCLSDNEEDIYAKVKMFKAMPVHERQVLGKNAKEYYKDYFTIEKSTSKYISVFRSLSDNI